MKKIKLVTEEQYMEAHKLPISHFLKDPMGVLRYESFRGDYFSRSNNNSWVERLEKFIYKNKIEFPEDLPVVITSSFSMYWCAGKHKVSKEYYPEMYQAASINFPVNGGKPFMTIRASVFGILNWLGFISARNTLTHELIHYYQWVRGDLKVVPEGVVWKGKLYTELIPPFTKIRDRISWEIVNKPWELEAYSLTSTKGEIRRLSAEAKEMVHGFMKDHKNKHG